jgi:hypothetical protein
VDFSGPPLLFQLIWKQAALQGDRHLQVMHAPIAAEDAAARVRIQDISLDDNPHAIVHDDFDLRITVSLKNNRRLAEGVRQRAW